MVEFDLWRVGVPVTLTGGVCQVTTLISSFKRFRNRAFHGGRYSVGSLFSKSWAIHRPMIQTVVLFLGFVVGTIVVPHALATEPGALSTASHDEGLPIRAESGQSLGQIWNDLESAIWKALEEEKGFKANDLISQSDAERVLKALRKTGWNPPKQDQLLKLVLADGHALVTLLKGSKGAAFMRKVSGKKNIYDQLDRLLQMPGGEKTVKAMTTAKDGYKLVDYYFGAAGSGNTLAQTLPRGISGKPPKDPDFEKPTGKIYTGEQLAAKLKLIFEAQVKASKQANRYPPSDGRNTK